MTRPAFRSRIMRILFLLSLAFFAYGLLRYTKDTSSAAVEGLSLCARVLIPSLFPFMVVSSLALGSGIAESAGRLFEVPMTKLFRVPGVCATAFILGLIGGYPVGAYNAVMLYNSGACTKTQAERLLAFCNNCGPAFILGVVGASMFGCTAAGVLLYCAHILSSVMIGLLFRFYRGGKTAAASSRPVQTKTEGTPVPSYPSLITRSVKSSARSVINVCAYVVFFSVAVKLLHLTGVIPALARLLTALLRPFDLPAAFMEKLISGIFELTGGIYGITGTGQGLKSITAAAFMLGWAGLSVHFQVLDFMCDSGLSPRPYIIGKMLHGGLSAVLAYIGAHLIPFDIETSKMLNGQMNAIYNCSGGRLFANALLCCLLLWVCLRLLSKIFARK
ncbi:MAG: sporulation protein [Clostridia bacterium]|nr:sporulation protein [Clostridia bacterium]